MTNKFKLILLLNLWVLPIFGQKLTLNKQEFQLKSVTGSIVEFQGDKALKIERDLKALPFSASNLGATVDEQPMPGY